MTQPPPRAGEVRDVPPPRPVRAEPGPEPATGGLGRAARVVADTVAGLLGAEGAPTGPAGTTSGRPSAGVLRDVLSAVAGVLRPGDDDAAAAAPPSGPAAATGRPGTGVLSDVLTAAAPRLPIRDRDRLRAAHPGASDAEIADALVARSVKLTSGIGAAVGGLAAAQWFAPPSLLALPLELGTETVLVAAVEVVLIGELHELYGRPATGDARERASAYLSSWSTQRAVGGQGSGGVLGALGTAGMGALRRRVTRRVAGNVTSTAPLLIGAGLGARSNRKATEKLAAAVLADLRTALPRTPGQRPTP